MPIQHVINKAGVRTLVWGMASAMELKAHQAWRAMRNRCRRTDDAFVDKKYYAEKGITVCERWENSFENFLADMGLPASHDLSLERKDGDKGYSPENCVWATHEEQANNRRTTRWITIDGVKKTLTQWSRESGVRIPTLLRRLQRRGPIAEILKPVGSMEWKTMRMLTIGDRTQCVSDWAREIGCTPEAMLYRIRHRFSDEELLKGRDEPHGRGRPVGSKNRIRP